MFFMEIVGLNEENIKKISEIKHEEQWILDYRLNSYKIFKELDMPNYGPSYELDFDKVIYYKNEDNKLNSNWSCINKNVKAEFEKLGVVDSEKYLDGIGVQYESEVIYHNMLEELVKKNVIFTSIEMAMKKYPDLVKKYFSKIVKPTDNKFAALNSAVFSGGSFIYIPPNTTLDRPLQSYFRINSRGMGQFERTLIIVDDNSHLHYVEGCTAPTYSDSSLHAAVVEIYVGKNSSCRYTTIQNWAVNVLNLVTKRALVEENGTMEWIDGNIGSRATMKYPACILKGDNSVGNSISIAYAKENQVLDAGAKMIHLGKNTKSNIVSKSIAENKGIANYRGTTRITKDAINSRATIKCDTILIDSISKSDTFPNNIVANSSSILEHEATVSKVSEEELFYLTSKGLTMDQAKELIIMGFVQEFKKELPMEYAVELNRLLKS